MELKEMVLNVCKENCVKPVGEMMDRYDFEIELFEPTRIWLLDENRKVRLSLRVEHGQVTFFYLQKNCPMPKNK